MSGLEPSVVFVIAAVVMLITVLLVAAWLARS
jgi:hypothetical protein